MLLMSGAEMKPSAVSSSYGGCSVSTPPISETAGEGKWTEPEQQQFERGCVLHGWGQWRFFKDVLPTRTTKQIKSHAQKFKLYHSEQRRRLLREHEMILSTKSTKNVDTTVSFKSQPRVSREDLFAKETITKDAAYITPFRPSPRKMNPKPIHGNDKNATSIATSKVMNHARDDSENGIPDLMPTNSPIRTRTSVTPKVDKESEIQLLNEDVLDFKEAESAADVLDLDWRSSHGNVPINLSLSKVAWYSANEVDGKLLDEIGCDREAYAMIHCTLTAPPNLSNPNEYVVRNDITTRTALNIPSLMRVRIKLMIKEHEKLAWWRDDAIETPSRKIYCVENFIALVLFVYNDTNWLMSTVVDDDGFTPCKFDEEDDILHVGQMVAYLWERANRSLSCDAYSKLGLDGMERGSAMNKIITIIVKRSRLAISELI